MKFCIYKELGIQIPHDESADDPYLVLGYGVNAYFEVLASLTKMFLIISLFSLPMFVIYASGDQYGEKTNPIARTFIGNFGATTMFAKASRFASGTMDISCPHGTILDAENANFGIMSNEF